MQQPILAAVDLGSNSFRLQIARVENGQLHMLDKLREPVRLGGGLTTDGYLDDAAQQRALACLQRFGERLRSLPREAVRAVGTNTLRVAKNAAEFLRQAEAALGFPIEVISGYEEARLIYKGVAHSLPITDGKHLVIDIGGGSTELIIGKGPEPLELESLHMGCVSYSMRYFPDGKITEAALEQAELAAQRELQKIAEEFSSGCWDAALGSSGSVHALCHILEQNGYNEGGITRQAMEKLRAHLLDAGDVHHIALRGLTPDIVPVMAGAFVIIYAVLRRFGIEKLQPAPGALREGVLYGLLEHSHHY